MAVKDYHEQQFFDALNDIFIGAKIEGESGYINLMHIKSRYYREGVFPQLKKDIDEAVKDFPDFREELFDKLYSFFQRYFSESGSIYFRYTPLHQNIYEKVYTDERDVVLFWKTHMLYYVKTDRLFKSLAVEVDGVKFWFDASTLELKKANEKRAIIFSYREKRADDTLVFEVGYSERGRITKQEDILKALKKEGVELSDETLNKAFRVFEKQSEVDFFINKDARAFLREQFDLWMYQYLFEGQNMWSEQRLAQLQALKAIAYKVIDFISQFEDELVKIWNKPKFVLNSNYVVTLHRIQDLALVEKISQHAGMPTQMEEWQQLGIVDETFQAEDIFEIDLTGRHLAPKYVHLPIDTKYFKDLELEILAQFENLDQALDGWLIKSENYQALNTLLPKFREKVQTIYIDPPFNTGGDFDYVDRFQDSSWLSLMSNRLEKAKNLISKKGSLFLHLDYNANYYGRSILNQIFGTENFRNEITWRRQIPRGMKAYAELFPFSADNILIFTKTDQPFWKPFIKINKLTIAEAEKKYNKDEKGFFRTSDPGTYSFDSLLKLYEEGRLYAPYGSEIVIDKKNKVIKATKGNLAVKYYRKQEGNFVIEEIPVDNIWDDIPGLGIASSQWIGFYTQKPEKLLKRVIESTSNESDLVLDFFLGSGTTTAVAHKLGRKWLGVEMEEHFYSVVLPRMKKVLAYDKSGISKEVKEYQGGGFFKYFELEQYEDVLRRTHYEDSDLFHDPSQDPYHAYVFRPDLKLLESLEADAETNTVHFHPERLYPDIDLAETLSHLRGKWIKRITAEYVEFEDGAQMSLTDPDWQTLKPMIWWQ